MKVGSFIRGYLLLTACALVAAAVAGVVVGGLRGLVAVLLGGVIGAADLLLLLWAGRALLGGRMRRPALFGALLPLKFIALTALLFALIALAHVHPLWFSAGVSAAVVALVVQSYRNRRVTGT